MVRTKQTASKRRKQSLDSSYPSGVPHGQSEIVERGFDSAAAAEIPPSHRFRSRSRSRDSSRRSGSSDHRRRRNRSSRSPSSRDTTVPPAADISAVGMSLPNTNAPACSLVEYQDRIIMNALKIAHDGDPIGKSIVTLVTNDATARRVVETFHRCNKTTEEAIEGLKTLFITP